MQALQLNWSLLGSHRLRVTPSKTAIVPVKSDFLPRTKEERALCARTVYVANIDKKVDKEDVLAYFEKICGEASSLMCPPPGSCDPCTSSCATGFPEQFCSDDAAVCCQAAGSGRLGISLNVDKISRLLGSGMMAADVQDTSQSAACCLTTTAPPASPLWSLPSMRAPRMPWTAAGL